MPRPLGPTLAPPAFALTLIVVVALAACADTKKKDAHIPLDWARRYPCEEVWRARKRG